MSGPVGTTPLLKKLRLSGGMRALVLNPPETFMDELKPLEGNLDLHNQVEGDFDFILIFARNSSVLFEHLNEAVESLVHDGLFWIAYPKKSSKVESDLSRNFFWNLLDEHEFRPVTQISIDTTWSALRFRHQSLVKKK